MLLISAGSQPLSQEPRHSSQNAKPNPTPCPRPCFSSSPNLSTGRISPPSVPGLLGHRWSLGYYVTASHLVLTVEHSRRAAVLLHTGRGQGLQGVCRLDLRLTPIKINWPCINSPFGGLAPPSTCQWAWWAKICGQDIILHRPWQPLDSRSTMSSINVYIYLKTNILFSRFEKHVSCHLTPKLVFLPFK